MSFLIFVSLIKKINFKLLLINERVNCFIRHRVVGWKGESYVRSQIGKKALMTGKVMEILIPQKRRFISARDFLDVSPILCRTIYILRQLSGEEVKRISQRVRMLLPTQ